MKFKTTEELKAMSLKEIAEYVIEIESEENEDNFYFDDYFGWCCDVLDAVIGEQDEQLENLIKELKTC